MNLKEHMDAERAWFESLRPQMERFAQSCAGYWLAIEHQEGLLTREQTDLVDQVMKTLRYHLELDGVEVTEAQARNVAAHLLLVVPEWRELLREAGGAKGPTF